MRPTWSSVPVAAWWTLAAHAVPLGSTLALGWDLREILFLFWLENAAIGAFLVAKMWTLPGFPRGVGLEEYLRYPAFVVIHGVLVFDIFVRRTDLPLLLAVTPSIVLLVVAHAKAFVQQWLRGVERESAQAKDMLSRAEPRMFALHAGVFLAVWITTRWSAPTLALAGVVALKAVAEFVIRWREARSVPEARGTDLQTGVRS